MNDDKAPTVQHFPFFSKQEFLYFPLSLGTFIAICFTQILFNIGQNTYNFV